MRYQYREFRHETVELDGNLFEDCKFFKCKLVFRAYQRVFFDRCTFTECDWSFDGSAETMLFFLRDLYHGLGFEGRQLVDIMVSGIREGTLPAAPTPEHTVVR